MTSTQEDPFKAIRPYNDDEVQPALQRLLEDKDFLRGLIRFRFGHWALRLEGVLLPLFQHILRLKWGNIHSIHAVQTRIAAYMKHMIEKTTTGMRCTGLENLSQETGYLFISNHRDIAMDPAFVNWALYQHGFQTVHIAIGDNLLRKPSATDLMKLNKSFLVKRSAKAPREMIQAYSELSAYIRQTTQEHHSIWIAQREGRAKDGDDRTEPAILKMFYMEGKRQKQPFDAYMQSLNLVPVSISYEFDPCAEAKAREIKSIQEHGHYEKSQMEDIESIIRGIVGFKGRVHVHFGEPLKQLSDQTPEQLAQHIDQEIHLGYHLFPSNLLAAGIEDPKTNVKEHQAFIEHIASFPRELTQIILEAYAKPVLNHQQAKNHASSQSVT